MEPFRFFVFVCVTIFLTASNCHAERKLELKPVTLISQVSPNSDASQAATTIVGLGTEERESVCKEGREKIGPDFEFSITGPTTTELREYAVEVKQTISQSPEGDVLTLEFVKAFECSTIPRTLIQVPTFNGRPDYNSTLTVIFKDEDEENVRKLESVSGYHLQFTPNITEADSDDLKSLSSKYLIKVRSYVDADELTEKQCVETCQKVSYMIPGKQFSPNASKRCSGNKYYFILDSSANPDSDDESASGKVAMQAFECATQPNIYVHVDEDTDLWFLMEGIDVPLPHNIMGYEQTPFVKVTQVPRETATQLLKQNPSLMVNSTSTVDFNPLTPDERLQLCRSTMQIIFGTQVKAVEGTPIAMSEFYEMQLTPDQNIRPVIVQAIVCPTDSIGLTYLHITNRDDNPKENVVQLYVDQIAAGVEEK